MRLRIQTWVFCGFAALIVLLSAVGSVAVSSTERIAGLAQTLNSRVVDKTRIAADVVSLVHQIRFVDGFVLQAENAEQTSLARSLIEERTRSLDGQIASYRNYLDSDLERSLLQNLARSRAAYTAIEHAILDKAAQGRDSDAQEDQQRLDVAFAEIQRQAKGLSVVAATQARAAREDAAAMMEHDRSLVRVVTGAGLAMAALIAAGLLVGIFRPLARVQAALIALSKGDLAVAMPRHNGGGEIREIVQALDVFRQNAVALSTANAETKAAHARADSLARHDVLTGLPNRRVLTDAIADTIARSERRGLACAVLLLDLDRFKPVNDIYGHSAGDKVLCEVARRLSVAVRATETVARLGGDEFAVVIEYDPGGDAPHRVAKRIAASIAEPITLQGRSVLVGTSIGIAVWPSDGGDAETLLHAADLAMFKSKRDRRGAFRFYEPEMDIQVRERADLEVRVHDAIRSGAIRPHFQPLVDLTTHTVTGFDVLARWYDGDRIRLPTEFIPIAEESGLIGELTATLLRQACRDCRSWPGDVTLAINITPAQMSDRRLPDVLTRILTEENFDPTRLELEITENALIGDVSVARAVIGDLRDRGIKVSLDDFGTGYSSLHHLRDLKFDKIKIDRSFVQTMLSNPESAKIVETVLGLGRSLGILTIAEGIEHEEHLRSLIDHGCQFGQGYHLGMPLAASAVSDLFDRSPRHDTRLPDAA